MTRPVPRITVPQPCRGRPARWPSQTRRRRARKLTSTCATPRPCGGFRRAREGPRRRRTPSWCEPTHTPARVAVHASRGGRPMRLAAASAWCLHHRSGCHRKRPSRRRRRGTAAAAGSAARGAAAAPPWRFRHRRRGGRSDPRALSAVRGDADVRATKSADAALRGLFTAYSKAPTRGRQNLASRMSSRSARLRHRTEPGRRRRGSLAVPRSREAEEGARPRVAQFLGLQRSSRAATLLDRRATDAASSAASSAGACGSRAPRGLRRVNVS